MPNKRISTPLAISIIIIVAILGGGMIYWQSLNIPERDFEKGSIEEDETADWKTYINQEYGFEMKYKPNLLGGEINEYQSAWWIGLPDVKSFEFTYCDNCPSSDTVIDHIDICQYSVIATIFDNALNLSFDDWFAKYGKDFGYSNQTKKEILVNEIKGIKTGPLDNLPPSGGGLDALVLLPKGSLIYSISLNVEEEVISSTTTYSQCFTSGSKTFDQMLPTFRFLD
jgi:hypothetical protein